MPTPTQSPRLEAAGARDAFTDSVLRKIDPAVLESLNPTQLAALLEALSASRPLQGHPIDFRGTIPLFFTHLYFVFLMGRDRRRATRAIEGQRRLMTRLAAWILLFLVALSPFLAILLIALYVLKGVFGINLFPNAHLSDFLGI